jgi:hypothetical protein
MVRFALCILLLAGAAGGAAAQELRELPVPKAEIGIGYSWARMPVPLASGRVSNHAVQLDVTRNVNRWLGMSGEFSAYYHCVAGCLPYSDIARNNSFVVIGGPRILLPRVGQVRPWLHAFFGGANMRFSEDLGANVSQNGFASALGGGIDYEMQRVNWRMVQLDYFRTPTPISQNNLRLGFGIGIRFGAIGRR